MRARGLSWFETRGDALLTIRDHNYGLIVMWVAGPGVRRGSASRANSHNSDLVLRGSMISSTQNRSAERNGERSLLRRSPAFPHLGFVSISALVASPIVALEAAATR